jgi:hypothetical protein
MYRLIAFKAMKRKVNVKTGAAAANSGGATEAGSVQKNAARPKNRAGMGTPKLEIICAMSMGYAVCPLFDGYSRCKVYDTFQDGYHKQTYCLSSDKWLQCANYEAYARR